MTFRSFAPVLVPVILLAMVLIVMLIRKPSVVQSPGGKILAFFALFLLPLLLIGEGTAQHLQLSKTTEFCLSCHTMEPYGRSLYIDDSNYVPANHFQNKRVPQDKACFTCHTNYAMFGDTKAKMNGLLHLWVYYSGRIPEKLALYQPYKNRECLHCHAGARFFDEDEIHSDMRQELVANEMSCLDCHDAFHAVGEHDELTFWEPGGTP